MFMVYRLYLGTNPTVRDAKLELEFFHLKFLFMLIYFSFLSELRVRVKVTL